jgi:exopolyphosphatase/guanosine-5'-triphosphate,3'-diphosphate pyrophosphatase
MTRRCASIDLGTNTARLLVADNSGDGTFEIIRIEREIVRMGGGFSQMTGLSRDAFDRGILCLKRFSDILKRYDISSLRAVATSAIRDAVNGREFVDCVFHQTGIKLIVIDGEMEGALTLSGVIAGLNAPHELLMVFDVGGGSTEYTLATSGLADFIRSLPLGVVRLTEGKSGPDQMLAKIRKELNVLAHEIEQNGSTVQSESTTLIGTAGTATTLAAISMEMDDYDYRRVNNAVLELDEIERIYAMLLPLSLEERVQVPGLEKGREDLIIAGILITLETMRQFGFSRLKVSDYGLLEGLIVSDYFPGT